LREQVVKNATVDLIVRGRQDEILALSFFVINRYNYNPVCHDWDF